MPKKQRSQRAAAAAAQNKIKEAVEEFDKPIEERSGRKPTWKPRGRAKVGCATKAHAAKPEAQASSVHRPAMQFDDLASVASLFDSDDDMSTESLVCVPNSATGKRKANHDHLQRRALREVNSNGPMKLSRRTSHRMASGYASTPIYSPIVAQELSFTPVATPSRFQLPPRQT
jgi:hypothetical protein